MAPHSSTLAWKIPWTEEPGRLQSMGSLGVGHDWVTSLSLFTFMHLRRKWQPTLVFLPGESHGRGSLVGCCLWGRTESDTLKRLSSSSSKVKWKSLSVWFLGTPETIACQAFLSMGFSRQEYWSGSLFASPGDHSNPGTEPRSPALQTDSLPSEPPGKPLAMPGFHSSIPFAHIAPSVCIQELYPLLFDHFLFIFQLSAYPLSRLCYKEQCVCVFYIRLRATWEQRYLFNICISTALIIISSYKWGNLPYTT